MNPLDNVGNQLNKGDLVAVSVGDRTLTGIIVEVKEASTLLAGEKQLPGMISIQIPIQFMFAPQAPRIQEVFKMQKPPNFNKPVS